MPKRKKKMDTECHDCGAIALCQWEGVLNRWLCAECARVERSHIKGANRVARRRNRENL